MDMATQRAVDASPRAGGSGIGRGLRQTVLSSHGDRQSTSPRKKASPSDVIFGQPPGKDAVSRSYEPLVADGMQPNALQSSHEERAGSDDAMARDSSSSISSTSTDSHKDAAMEVEHPATSFHATPSTTATTETSLAEAPLLESDENVKVLPASFEDADPEDVVTLVADMLIRLTAHNDMLPLHPSALTRFHSRAAPGITVLSYLKRIAKYTSLEKSCTLILLVYIDRVCQRIAGFTICSLTVHRFVCAAVVCASKALCDSFSTNGHYARVGGISLVELNMLEKEFLNIIDWKLSCSGALLQHYYTSLVRSHGAYRLGSPAQKPIDESNE